MRSRVWIALVLAGSLPSACGKPSNLGAALCEKLATCSGTVSKEPCVKDVRDILEDRRATASEIGGCEACIADNCCKEILVERDCDYACASIQQVTTVHASPCTRRQLCHTVHRYCGDIDNIPSDDRVQCGNEACDTKAGGGSTLPALTKDCEAELQATIIDTPELDVAFGACLRCVDPVAALPRGVGGSGGAPQNMGGAAGAETEGTTGTGATSASPLCDVDIDRIATDRREASAAAYVCQELGQCQDVCADLPPIRLRLAAGRAINRICESGIGECFQRPDHNLCVEELWRALHVKVMEDEQLEYGEAFPAEASLVTAELAQLDQCARCLDPDSDAQPTDAGAAPLESPKSSAPASEAAQTGDPALRCGEALTLCELECGGLAGIEPIFGLLADINDYCEERNPMCNKNDDWSCQIEALYFGERLAGFK